MNLLFALESFRRHMDNGRWLFQLGMERNGYASVGNSMPYPGFALTDVAECVSLFNPKIVVFWPRYEWDTAEWRGPYLTSEDKFRNWECLLDRKDILRVTVWHDSGSAREEQRRWHADFKPHVYLTWYHDDSVLRFADYINPSQLVRTYHIIDPQQCPKIQPRDNDCIVSGAYSHDVYPFRIRAMNWANSGHLGQSTVYMRHPGYGQEGTTSQLYMDALSQYRVAICTASSYKFALRKIFEATAAGCRIITDLPEYDAIPGIDSNLTRVSPNIECSELRNLISDLSDGWNLSKQTQLSGVAKDLYGYKTECKRLSSRLSEKWNEFCNDPS